MSSVHCRSYIPHQIRHVFQKNLNCWKTIWYQIRVMPSTKNPQSVKQMLSRWHAWYLNENTLVAFALVIRQYSNCSEYGMHFSQEVIQANSTGDEPKQYGSARRSPYRCSWTEHNHRQYIAMKQQTSLELRLLCIKWCSLQRRRRHHINWDRNYWWSWTTPSRYFWTNWFSYSIRKVPIHCVTGFETRDDVDNASPISRRYNTSKKGSSPLSFENMTDHEMHDEPGNQNINCIVSLVIMNKMLPITVKHQCQGMRRIRSMYDVCCKQHDCSGR